MFADNRYGGGSSRRFETQDAKVPDTYVWTYSDLELAQNCFSHIFDVTRKAESDPDFQKMCLQRLQGHTLVDLGAGVYGTGYIFAREVGVALYIAVERFHWETLARNLNFVGPSRSGKVSIPFRVVGMDMLEFLQSGHVRQMPQPVSFLASALDQLPGLYCEKVAEALDAVLVDGACLINYSTNVIQPKTCGEPEKFRALFEGWLYTK